MYKEPVLTIEKFRDGEERKFLIKSPKEIQLTLHAIAQKKTSTIIYFDNNERFLKSLLLAANDKGMWLDVGPDHNDNNQIAHTENLTLVTMHNGAKVQLAGNHVQIYAGHPAFYLPLPSAIYRVQRRDYFRLSASAADAPLKCVIPPAAEKQQHLHEVTILDISAGGIALVCRESSVRLEAGEIYPDCKIELPGVGTLTATIEVKNLFDVNSSGGTVIKHAGCEFKHLDGQMSMLLQRYISMMQSKLSR
jgi:flagellar brake protein